MNEDDYIANNDQARKLLSNTKIKKESTPDDVSNPTLASPIPRSHKRLRRSTTSSIHSYAVPDSDDDAIMYGEHIEDRYEKKKFRASGLQLWIKHLAELLKAEQRKVRYSPLKLTLHTSLSNSSIMNIRDVKKGLQSQE